MEDQYLLIRCKKEHGLQDDPVEEHEGIPRAEPQKLFVNRTIESMQVVPLQAGQAIAIAQDFATGLTIYKVNTEITPESFNVTLENIPLGKFFKT